MSTFEDYLARELGYFTGINHSQSNTRLIAVELRTRSLYSIKAADAKRSLIAVSVGLHCSIRYCNSHHALGDHLRRRKHK